MCMLFVISLSCKPFIMIPVTLIYTVTSDLFCDIVFDITMFGVRNLQVDTILKWLREGVKKEFTVSFFFFANDMRHLTGLFSANCMWRRNVSKSVCVCVCVCVFGVGGRGGGGRCGRRIGDMRVSGIGLKLQGRDRGEGIGKGVR